MYIEGGRGEQISCGEAECIWRGDFLEGGLRRRPDRVSFLLGWWCGELVVWKTLSFPPGTRGEGDAVRRRGEGPGPCLGRGACIWGVCFLAERYLFTG